MMGIYGLSHAEATSVDVAGTSLGMLSGAGVASDEEPLGLTGACVSAGCGALPKLHASMDTINGIAAIKGRYFLVFINLSFEYGWYVGGTV